MQPIAQPFPDYDLEAVDSIAEGAPFVRLSPASHEGQWRVFVFYPKDFTFVCPTELKGFGDLARDFADRDAQLIGVSTDSAFVHLAWRKDHDDLRDLPYPLASDLDRSLSQELGILDEEGVARRATYIVDPDGIVRFVSVHDGSVGRNPDEVLRVLDALQTDELCPCNWKQGDATIQLPSAEEVPA